MNTTVIENSLHNGSCSKGASALQLVICLIISSCLWLLAYIDFSFLGKIDIQNKSELTIDITFLILNSLPFANIGSAGVFVLIFITLLCYLRSNPKIKWDLIIISTFFAIVSTTCKSYTLTNTSVLLTGGISIFLLSTFLIIALAFIFYISAELFKTYAIKFFSSNNFTMRVQYNKQNYILLTLLLIVLLWIPTLIIFYPGSSGWDYWYMISCWNGDIQWNQHHPVIPTVIYGALMDLGHYLGQDNLGVFFSVFINCILMLYAIYATLAFILDRTSCRKTVCVLFIIYFGLIPIFSGYIQLSYKDSIGMAINLLLCTCIINCLYDERWIHKTGNYFIFLFSTIVSLLVKNTGTYFVYTCLAGLLVYF